MSWAAAIGIRLAVRALRIDVDQAHLHGGERIFEVALAGIALVARARSSRRPSRRPGPAPRRPRDRRRNRTVLKPIVSSATLPVRIIRSAQEILLAVLLLDRPEQPTRLVQADVVRPAVERREALLPRPPPPRPSPVRYVPALCHAMRMNKRPVVTEVRRPPVLRVGHQRREVLLHRREVEALELLSRSRSPRPSDWTWRNAGAGCRAAAGSATSHGSRYRHRRCG